MGCKDPAGTPSEGRFCQLLGEENPSQPVTGRYS